jgi:hypothetical protein
MIYLKNVQIQQQSAFKKFYKYIYNNTNLFYQSHFKLSLLKIIAEKNLD